MSTSGSGASSSSSATRGGNGGARRPRPGWDIEIWPEDFVETIIVSIAIAVAERGTRLAAAQEIANLFMVSSTWRAASQSELLWERLVRVVWGKTMRVRPTWREEYIYNHRIARNFRTGRARHYELRFDHSDIRNLFDGTTCRCVALTDTYLACGFLDGAVRVFDVASRQEIRTFRPLERDFRIGAFAASISGIILTGHKIVFSTLDGDIHAAMINEETPVRRIRMGEYVRDGSCASFAGNERFWVGMYAGMPNRSFCVWDAATEEILFFGGNFMDHYAGTSGLNMVTDWAEFLARVRVNSEGIACACTHSRVAVFDMRHDALQLVNEMRQDIVVGSFDANEEACVAVEGFGLGRVSRVPNLQDIYRFQGLEG
ncbi:transcriptional regulator STERILE APETALA [Tripterygium wilfordii]|uniref:Transcriptional regulator STERILE APETALA n=1 Tax=Tripterygium wilfordii TaxID=458696 RepID=A0A7J7D4X9_TRIWF|nr:transcriptional regulator STERILE APETALA [Tripterygium wilfordii]